MKAKINAQLDTPELTRPLDWFKLETRNVKKHGKISIDGIKGSLREFGQQKPVVCLENGNVVAGNGTVQAAQELKWERLAVVTFPDREKARAFALADNRVADLAEYDDAIVLADMQASKAQGIKLETLGYTDDYMLTLMQEQSAGAGAAFIKDIAGGGVPPPDGPSPPSTGPTVSIGLRAEYVDLVLSMTVEQRAYVYQRLRDIKAKNNLTTTTDAFLHVLRSIP